MTANQQTGNSKNWIIAIIVVGIIAAAAIALWQFKSPGKDDSQSMMATFKVKRGPLMISVTEKGTIKAQSQEIIKSEIEGRTTVLSLVPEGKQVEKGELLVELDVSVMEDNRIDQEIDVQNAQATLIGAQEDLAVTKNQSQSDIEQAELTLEFAQEDYDIYIAKEFPNLKDDADKTIAIAKLEETQANNKLDGSKRLFADKYISELELKSDELSKERSKLSLKSAENDKDLLINYTFKRNKRQLESNIRQAKMALERTQRKSRASVIQAQATLKARTSEHDRQVDKLKKMDDQLAKGKIYAPYAGQVIYATSTKFRWRGNTEPLEIGSEIREREEIIHLPTSNSMKAAVAIHEASLKKVIPELPAIITVDALPGKRFMGSVARIAPLPDPSSMWMNPDLKQYDTDVNLEISDENLRTGMSCQVKIIIAQYQDALYIPVQAVIRIGDTPTVFVLNGNKIEARDVQIGLDNNRVVHIINGLKENEEVLLTPPMDEGTAGHSTEGEIKDDTDETEFNQKIQDKIKKANELPKNGKSKPGAKISKPSGPKGPPGGKRPGGPKSSGQRRPGSGGGRK